ncbi:hypothetical protein ABVT39_021032 [Epinephelus coioides]
MSSECDGRPMSVGRVFLALRASGLPGQCVSTPQQQSEESLNEPSCDLAVAESEKGRSSLCSLLEDTSVTPACDVLHVEQLTSADSVLLPHAGEHRMSKSCIMRLNKHQRISITYCNSSDMLEQDSEMY